MNETKRINLYLDYISDEGKKTVSELNEILNEYGLSFEFEDKDRFTINFDTKAFEKKTTRGAGAKHKFIGKTYALADLKSRMAASSAQEVADEIAVSRSTLYRRMKVAEDCGDETVYF